ncbi:hypothetical protein [Nocardioides speluncae]|uniref:hypothetical protein n=1 Tax=Nocardioides speluncae TaxID=2670337 RepID=UPI000D69C8D4|nr:hypothetical protein [Nocardioides speluncae]
MTGELTVRAVVDGRDVPRDQTLAWEARRLPRAAKRIRLEPPPGELPDQRLEFARAKADLGADEVRRRLRLPLRASEAATLPVVVLSRRGRRFSVCDLYVTGGDAAEFVAWFSDTGRPDYELSMLAANPDHFLIATAPDGRQEVIETTGGSPLPARFLIDYVDVADLVTPVDPEFPLVLAGVARSRSGRAIGGVRHQFRPTDDGFHARLAVEFPILTPPYLIQQHCLHLAVEFTNWIEAAFADRGLH